MTNIRYGGKFGPTLFGAPANWAPADGFVTWVFEPYPHSTDDQKWTILMMRKIGANLGCVLTNGSDQQSEPTRVISAQCRTIP